MTCRITALLFKPDLYLYSGCNQKVPLFVLALLDEVLKVILPTTIHSLAHFYEV